jgi:hypothetical protein
MFYKKRGVDSIYMGEGEQKFATQIRHKIMRPQLRIYSCTVLYLLKFATDAEC